MNSQSSCMRTSTASWEWPYQRWFWLWLWEKVLTPSNWILSPALLIQVWWLQAYEHWLWLDLLLASPWQNLLVFISRLSETLLLIQLAPAMYESASILWFCFLFWVGNLKSWKQPLWRSNSRAQGLKHIELDSNKPLQQLRVLLNYIESILPHPCLGSPWWFRLPMVSLYILWLTTQTVLWGRRAGFQPNNSLERENLWLMKIKGCIHTRLWIHIATEWWEKKYDS